MKKPTKAAVIPIGYYNGISAGVTGSRFDCRAAPVAGG
jgi:hypothetical protein